MDEENNIFNNGLEEIIKSYSTLLENKLNSNEQEGPNIGNHICLETFENLEKVKELFKAFDSNYTGDHRIDKILQLWGSGQKADFSFLGGEFKDREYSRLINSVSNMIRLQVCLKDEKKNPEGLTELANLIYNTVNNIKIVDEDDKRWDDVIVNGEITLQEKNNYLNNDIQAFLKEMYYCVNYEADTFPLWNGCTKNALNYITEIEFSKNQKPSSKLELIEKIKEGIKPGNNTLNKYKPFFLVDQLFNLFDKITPKDLASNDDKISNFYQQVWKYLLKSPSWRKRRLKSSGDLLKLFESGEGKNIILYGPPGTSKTYGVEESIKELLRQELENNDYNGDNIDADIIEQYKNRVKLIQFHPSYDYEDFIEGYKIKQNKEKDIYFEKTNGHFKDFVENIAKDKNLSYFFIIDEINRADLAKVLGELMYCLEKRGNEMNLRYSTDKTFSIPSNVFIIGTMNTTDKSVEAFDIALRRRFIWLHRDYDEEILKEMLLDTGISIENGNGKNLLDFAKNLNNKISNNPNLGENYKIGQAIFQKAIDGKKINTKEFEDFHLKPLLKEYLRFSVENEIELNKQVENLIKESKPKKQESEN